MKKIFTMAAALILSLQLSAQNFYGGLDQWRTVTVFTAPGAGLEAPQGLFTADSLIQLAKLFYPDASFKKQVYQSTDKHGGSHAAQLVTIDQDSLGTVPGILSNARLDFDIQNLDPNDPLASLSYTGGTAINQRISEISAWVKYAPRANDTASINVRSVLSGAGAGGADSIVGEGTYDIAGSIGSYTKVTVPITYINGTVVPDKILILIQSSGLGGGQDSSELWVDDIAVASLGISSTLQPVKTVSAWPNPAKDLLNLELNGEGLMFQAYDMGGKLVIKQQLHQAAAINTTALGTGSYIFRIYNKAGVATGIGKFEVVK